MKYILIWIMTYQTHVPTFGFEFESQEACEYARGLAIQKLASDDVLKYSWNQSRRSVEHWRNYTLCVPKGKANA